MYVKLSKKNNILKKVYVCFVLGFNALCYFNCCLPRNSRFISLDFYFEEIIVWLCNQSVIVTLSY